MSTVLTVIHQPPPWSPPLCPHASSASTSARHLQNLAEMEVHRVVKQENPYEFDFPQSLNHTNDRQYHDPTMIELPLVKFQRALNPPVEQLSATLQTTPNVETDNVHHTNGLERLAVAASDISSASELEEPPNARATEKAQVVAEMVEYAFATCEGSNFNAGTRIMVSNLLQFLCKQYEEDKALAVVEIERLKDEKMKLEELKKGVRNSSDLEHENEELKTVILTMGVDMDVLKEKYNRVQSEFLSSKREIEKLKKEQCRIFENGSCSSQQQVDLLKAAIRDKDKKIDLRNEEITVLRERVGKETYRIHETTPNPPIVTPKLKQVPLVLSQCDPVTQETEGPKRKKTRHKKSLDRASVSISGSMNAIAPQKFGAELSGLLTAIMTLGKTLDCKMRVLIMVANPQLSRETHWNLCISHIAPPGYRFDTNTVFKMVWNHWISAIMFQDFEDLSFGLKEAVGSPENLDASTKLGVFDGNCSRFLAFVRKKHQLLFPPWMYRAPLLKFLDADVYSKFKVIAEKMWMLHRIGRACALPPSIFRPVPLGTRYDTQYHESRTHLPEATEPHVIMLVLTPGFVVGEIVIKSQVLVRKM